MIDEQETHLRKSALVMRIVGWGILANLLHGLVMIPQAFLYPNEHAHLWTDIPVCFVLVAVMWIWHHNRVRR